MNDQINLNRVDSKNRGSAEIDPMNLALTRYTLKDRSGLSYRDRAQQHLLSVPAIPIKARNNRIAAKMEKAGITSIDVDNFKVVYGT